MEPGMVLVHFGLELAGYKQTALFGLEQGVNFPEIWTQISSSRVLILCRSK